MKTTNAYITANTLLAKSWVGLQIFTITCHLSRPPVDGRRRPSAAALDGTDRLHPVLGLHRTGRDRPRSSRPDCRPDGTIRSTAFECLLILPLPTKHRGHVVDCVESGRAVFSEGLLEAIEGPLVPFECLLVLPLVVENQDHVVDGFESGRVALSEGLLVAIEGPLVPFECLVILALFVQHPGHGVNC